MGSRAILFLTRGQREQSLMMRMKYLTSRVLGLRQPGGDKSLDTSAETSPSLLLYFLCSSFQHEQTTRDVRGTDSVPKYHYSSKMCSILNVTQVQTQEVAKYTVNTANGRESTVFGSFR